MWLKKQYIFSMYCTIIIWKLPFLKGTRQFQPFFFCLRNFEMLFFQGQKYIRTKNNIINRSNQNWCIKLWNDSVLPTERNVFASFLSSTISIRTHVTCFSILETTWAIGSLMHKYILFYVVFLKQNWGGNWSSWWELYWKIGTFWIPKCHSN